MCIRDSCCCIWVDEIRCAQGIRQSSVACGDRLIDADAGSDWLVVNGHLYYWHADPEQAYGFRDLMLYAPQGTASPEPIPAGEQLRARLIEFGGALYLTNYDSELYRIDDSANEPEYIRCV